MNLPIEYNGQIYDVAKNPNTHNAYAVIVIRTVYLSDEEMLRINADDDTVEICETIGHIYADDRDEDLVYLDAQVRYGFDHEVVRSLDKAVAFIADMYKACDHDFDSEQTEGNRWHCNVCSADFEREDEDGPEGDEDEDWDLDGPGHVREDIPWGTPDSWIPDNPNEDGFRESDFI